jgi:hypothetical protein
MKLHRLKNIEASSTLVIYSGSFSYRLIYPLYHDPVARSHHIHLDLVSALIDPQPSDIPDDHIFLLFDSEPLT